MQTASPLYDLLEAIDTCAAESHRIAVESAHIAARLLQANEPETPRYISVETYLANVSAPFWE